MSSQPLVSVVVISYNHEIYIKECLDSILSQKDVNFELIVADDASTDNTQDTIRLYAKKDARIKPILRKRNVGITSNLIDAMDSAKGKYIALCEADDYWNNDRKLFKQLQIMEKDERVTVCFHPVRVVKSNGKDKIGVFPETRNQFTLEALIAANFIQTNSVMYRNIGPYGGLFYEGALPLDWLLHVYHARKGKIAFVNSVMSSYRKHDKGVWWRDDNNIRTFWTKNADKHFKMFDNMSKIVKGDSKLENLVHESSKDLVNSLVTELEKVDGEEVVQSILSNYPTLTVDSLIKAIINLRRTKEELVALDNKCSYLTAEMERVREDRDRILNLLHANQESLSWRITAPLRRISTLFRITR